MLRLESPAAIRAPSRAEWIVLALSLLTGAVGVLLACATSEPAEGQTVTVGAGEIRSGQVHRQDALELEARTSVGPVEVGVLASFRHGERDHDNRPWPPFLQATVGPRLGWFALHAGLQSYPWNVGRWTPLAGPRLDIPLGPRARLHISNLWRRDGLVGTRMGRWTPATRFRLDWRLVG